MKGTTMKKALGILLALTLAAIAAPAAADGIETEKSGSTGFTFPYNSTHW
jgi:hypothetical protein